ncbi:MAG: putative ATP-binding cassette transporter [Alteromonadaceae bacterium]|jgi:putative ATP-binding cassette transporter
MNLFASFIEKAPNKVFISITLGALAGISYAMLIPLILSALESPEGLFQPVESRGELFLSFEIANYPFALMFASVCLFILVARTCSQVILTRVAMDVTTALRIKMYHQISNAPIIALENVGGAKLIASLTTDVPRMVMGARLLPVLLINGVTLLGMLTYLLYLNSAVFWFVLQCIFFGMVTYKLPMVLAERYMRQAREHVDGLHGAIQGLINGSKELKLNRKKRDVYFEQELINYEHQVLNADKTGQTIYRLAVNYGDLISFFVIGAVAFVFVNYHTVTGSELIGVIMVLLYISGPIAILLSFMPQVAISQISMNKVQRLFAQLPKEDDQNTGASLDDWQSITFKDVTYQYGDASAFKVGPLNFSINRGELTFIIGGNGSGKSTISKLITHHYLPDSGEVYFDQQLIDSATLSGARQCIGAIYSDYHLFSRILENDDDGQLHGKIDKYLKELGLEHKVTYTDGKFSSLNLSDGQKRRLALLVAYIEDKELYLFDEWAADQDPVFKDIFYNSILPELKAQGKAVVVISHDDRYFELADQLIVMNEGQVVQNIGSQHKDLLDLYVTKKKPVDKAQDPTQATQ